MKLSILRPDIVDMHLVDYFVLFLGGDIHIGIHLYDFVPLSLCERYRRVEAVTGSEFTRVGSAFRLSARAKPCISLSTMDGRV